MKKKILSLSILVLLALNLYGGPFSDLANSFNSLTDSDEVEFIECKLPEGRDIFPLVWNLANVELQSADKKVLAQNIDLLSINVFEHTYKITFSQVYKFGIGTQRQDGVLIITEDDGKFFVGTENLIVYNVDRKGRQTSEGSKMSASSRKAVSKQISETIELLDKQLSDEDYKSICEKSVYNMETFTSINATAKNALMAKKWHKDHPTDNKIFNVSRMSVTKVDLSDKDGYDYKITGAYYSSGKDPDDVVITFIDYYSNDEKMAELTEKDSISVSGNVAKMTFDELLHGPYRVSGITLLENK